MTEFTLVVAGREYGGWKTLSATRSLRDAASVFSVSLSERWAGQGTPLPIKPGAPCVLNLAGEPVITGHVDVYDPRSTDREHQVTAEGRSKTADMVDCAAVVEGGQFRGYTVAQVARALASPFGIEVVQVGDVGNVFPDVQVQQGETCFALIERLSRMRGLLISDDPAGRLLLGRLEGYDTRDPIPLREGREIISVGGRQDWSRRFSSYTVKAQRSPTDEFPGAAASEVQGVASDPDVSRYRPWLEVAEASADDGDAQRRAAWQASTAAGRATVADVTVRGWRASDSVLWSVGRRVHVSAPTVHVDRELVVERVEFQTGESGTITKLTAVPAQALAPEPLTETDTAESLL